EARPPFFVWDAAHARSPVELARPYRRLARMCRLRPTVMLPSTHRGPRAVRIAASVAACDLRLAVDIDGVGVRPALQSVGLIGGTRNHPSLTTGIASLPRHPHTPLSAFERLHLRRIRAPPV